MGLGDKTTTMWGFRLGGGTAGNLVLEKLTETYSVQPGRVFIDPVDGRLKLSYVTPSGEIAFYTMADMETLVSEGLLPFTASGLEDLKTQLQDLTTRIDGLGAVPSEAQIRQIVIAEISGADSIEELKTYFDTLANREYLDEADVERIVGELLSNTDTAALNTWLASKLAEFLTSLNDLSEEEVNILISSALREGKYTTETTVDEKIKAAERGVAYLMGRGF